MTLHGKDIGRWLATQRRDFRQLTEEQQRRLAELGVKPARAVRARTEATAAGAAPRPGGARKHSRRAHSVPRTGRQRPARPSPP
ncbi:helicase associated domain-containing protein [Streptomyces sp. NPDC057686]|uniref:helicase associated domain-containing protein n=1 Tax=Streptomyces sp. NPDC057686 TaxID=3346212 RepID=UPI00369265E9